MRIDVITVHPELLASPFSHSILKRARQKGLLEINLINLRDFAKNKHRTTDDYQYGGGAGMVMLCEPIANCLDHLLSERNYDEIIYMTPDGETLQQQTVNQLSLKQNIIILCGHYKGVDERIRQLYITKEISIGDYVLSGGELPAAVLIDAIGRLIPGVLNDETSALFDSFQDGLLSYPVYSRPEVFRGLKVPDVLLSGNEKLIREWRYEKALERTRARRPDLLKE
ncbi:MAG: tRNA (guanosine(37)-N1)-methyltransferase TrmD [Chitinophagales bacterium]|nr:tRNA (guanosine(37)-N1)-methyltransferase TrmD [Chitinophagales bacterium]MDW8419359.1 tRNA (guanosine(37)-N1)-methyltransferase TrmD [Chitinophagales bacterium]